jgi:urease gamma subunit
MKKWQKRSVSAQSVARRFKADMRMKHPELYASIRKFITTLRKAGVKVNELVMWERTLDLLQDEKQMARLKASYEKLMAAEADFANQMKRSRRTRS